MRADEIRAKELLHKYLSCRYDNFTIDEGEDPPDFYFIQGEDKVLLEATSAEPIYLGSVEGEIENRNTSDESLVRYCKKLNRELGQIISPGKAIFLHIKAPVINYPKFKRAMKCTIEDYLQNPDKLASIQERLTKVEVEGNCVEIRYINSNQEARVIGIVGVLSNRSVPDIEEQAILILRRRIREKENKTKTINGEKWRGEKWLVIINMNFLADSRLYKRAISKIEVPHNFSKIFLIDLDDSVAEIFNS